MTIAKVRGLSKYGVVSDVDAYDLPPEAFSFAVNARFHNGHATHSPVFRTAAPLANVNPRTLAQWTSSAGVESLYVGYKSGRINKWTPTAETNFSIAGYADSDSTSLFTSCVLADVLYVNRSDRVPWRLKSSDSAFVALENWTSTWRAGLLKSCGGALVALNITKAGVAYPTMYKTSNFALSGAVPTTWDETDTTNNATQNIFGGMQGQIVDANLLRSSLIVYALNETWALDADGSTSVFSNRRIFQNAGAISANCSVEVNGQHYVLGPNDIWTHDGSTKVSIVDQKTRDFIFGSLNVANKAFCFVQYNAPLNQIMFAYQSTDSGCTFVGADGANRGAVYDLAEKTWTFVDLPFVFAMTPAALSGAVTWQDLTGTWDALGGSWASYEASTQKNFAALGDTNATFSLTKSLYAYDLYGPGSQSTYPVDANASLGMRLERDGIDLDELGADLRGHKVIRAIYPQARLDAGTNLEFSFGASDSYNVAPVFSDYMSYDGVLNNKCDFMASGRYLSMKVRFNSYKYVSISGYDVDLEVTSEM